MEHLFDDWKSIEDEIKYCSSVFIFLDYDGTLTPIVDKPEMAVLCDSTRDVLKKIVEDPRFMLGVISGRGLSEIKKIVGLDGIYYAGNHGLECVGPDLRYLHPNVKGVEGVTKRVSDELVASTKDIKGVLIENKGLAVVLHYRMVSKEDRAALKSVFMDTVQPYLRGEGFRVSENKMTLEFTPDVSWTKGDIILKIIKKKKNNLVIYIGDDQTDENVFKALGDRGLTVVVGRKKSNARYYVNNVDEVIEFLKNLRNLSFVNKNV